VGHHCAPVQGRHIHRVLASSIPCSVSLPLLPHTQETTSKAGAVRSGGDSSDAGASRKRRDDEGQRQIEEQRGQLGSRRAQWSPPLKMGESTWLGLNPQEAHGQAQPRLQGIREAEEEEYESRLRLHAHASPCSLLQLSYFSVLEHQGNSLIVVIKFGALVPNGE